MAPNREGIAAVQAAHPQYHPEHAGHARLGDAISNAATPRRTCDQCGRPVPGLVAAAGVFCSEVCASAFDTENHS